MNPSNQGAGHLLQLALAVVVILAIVYLVKVRNGNTEGYSATLLSPFARSGAKGHDYTKGVHSTGGIREPTLQSTHRSTMYSRGPMV